MFSVPLAIVGLLLGGIGAFLALRRDGSGIGYSIAGIATNGLCLIAVYLFVSVVSAILFPSADPVADPDNDEVSVSNQIDDDDETALPVIRKGRLVSTKPRQLGNLKVTPMAAEYRDIMVEKGVFNTSVEREGPYLVLTFRAENTSEGQVFRPYTKVVSATDNFGNKLDDPHEYSDTIVVENEELTELQPGQACKVVLVRKLKYAKATTFVWQLQTQVDNQSDFPSWEVQFELPLESPE